MRAAVYLMSTRCWPASESGGTTFANRSHAATNFERHSGMSNAGYACSSPSFAGRSDRNHRTFVARGLRHLVIREDSAVSGVLGELPFSSMSRTWSYRFAASGQFFFQ